MLRTDLTADLTIREHVHLMRFLSAPERINMSLQPTREEMAAKIGHIQTISSLYMSAESCGQPFYFWHLSFLSHLYVEDLEVMADDTATMNAYVHECIPFIKQCKYTDREPPVNLGDEPH